MRRTIFLASLVMTLLLTSAISSWAQESTPVDDPLAGTTVESLGGIPLEMADGYALAMLKLTLEPGVTIPAHHHPGSVVLYVLAGTFGTTFTEGEAVVTRGATGATPAATEPVEIGTETVLEAGDSVSYEGDTHHSMSNIGDEPLVLMVAAVLDANEPGFIFGESA